MFCFFEIPENYFSDSFNPLWHMDSILKYEN